MRWTYALVIFVGLAGCAAETAPNDDSAATEDDLTAAQTAGAFQHWHPNKQKGEISQLFLRPDKTFRFLVEGEYGCDVYAGYFCPSSWSDGRSGSTYVSGTWKANATGVVLQPTGEGRPSAPIPMTITRTAKTARVEGTIVPNRRIFGELEVVALFAKPHSAREADLDGTWTFTTPQDKDGFHPRLDGSSMFVGTQYEHFVTFRSGTRSYVEDRVEPGKKSRRKKDDGTYWIAGAPDGSGGAGVLVLDRGALFDHLIVTKISGTELEVVTNPGEHASTLTADKR